MARKSGIANDRRSWLDSLQNGHEVALFERGEFARIVTVQRTQKQFKFYHGGNPVSLSTATGVLDTLSFEPITPDVQKMEERRQVESARQYAVYLLESEVENWRKRLDENKTRFNASLETNPAYAVENYSADLILAQTVYAVMIRIGAFLKGEHPFDELVSYITAEHAKIIRDLTNSYTWSPSSTSAMSNVVKTIKAQALAECFDIFNRFLGVAKRGMA